MNIKILIELIENISNSKREGPLSETVQEELGDVELSLVDRAIIDAYLLRESGKIADAIEKWRSIANIAEEADNELAAHAWFSMGGLLSDNNPEEALLAYNKAIHLDSQYTDAYYNRARAKSRLSHYEAAISILMRHSV